MIGTPRLSSPVAFESPKHGGDTAAKVDPTVVENPRLFAALCLQESIMPEVGLDKVGCVLSGNEYRVLVEQAPMLIWRANTTGECDYFNERWLNFRGRTIDQEFGNGWAEGVHRDDLDRCLKIYAEAFRKRITFEMEYRILRHDGVYRWIFDRGAPYFGDDGQFGGYVGSCVDVTDRVHAEEAVMRRRLAQLAQLQSLLPICSYCRKVRDDHGYWQRVEEYVSDHTMTEFSHGVCPTCLSAETRKLALTPADQPVPSSDPD